MSSELYPKEQISRDESSGDLSSKTPEELYDEFRGVMGLFLGSLLYAVDLRLQEGNLQEDDELIQAKKSLSDRTSTIVNGIRKGYSPKTLERFMDKAGGHFYATEGVLIEQHMEDGELKRRYHMDRERLVKSLNITSNFITNEEELGELLTKEARRDLNSSGRLDEKV
jgi:hypothetical protein